MWRAKYKPRYVGQRLRHPTITDTVSSNHVPWIVAGVSYLVSMVLLFSIRVLLARENKRRDAERRDDTFDDVHVLRIDGDGKRTEVKISKVRTHSHWKACIFL
jgi:MFS transporter, ACS family, allantoate permease